MTKPVEIRKFSLPEIEEKVEAARRQLFVLRVQHGQRQLTKTSQMRDARRELARLSTVLGEKRRDGGKTGGAR
jgi:large subunit ribosomal protein L29